MSDDPQMGPGFGFPEGFDLSQVMRLFASPGPVNWEAAQMVARLVADSDPSTGATRPQLPTAEEASAAFDAIVRAAQTSVADATGVAQTLGVPWRCVDRAHWAEATLAGLRPVLESLAGPLAARSIDDDTDDASEDTSAANGDDIFAGLMQSMMPILLGVWAGSMIGYLAQHALGQYDLPLPLAGDTSVLFVAENIDQFASEWSLPVDEVRYALALREVVHGAQRSVPWVRDRLVRLASEYVGAYEVRADALEDQLSAFDLTDITQLGNIPDIMGDPTHLLGAMQSARQVPILDELQRFTSVLEGYTDVTAARIGAHMVPSFTRIDEAVRRHRVERGQAAAFVDRLLGLELDRDHYERGTAFCEGVVERAGADGLNRLWDRETMVPTAAEFDAPGLWLARIEYDAG